MGNPKVSVILPTFNRAAVLKNAIRSVLGQSLKGFELIIINDGSTDKTEGVILGFKDPRIVYLKKKHGGPAAARNLGLSKACGKYVSYLDDDDIYYPGHLKILSGFLDKHPHCGLVYAKAHFQKNGKIFLAYPFGYSKKWLEVDNIIPYNSLMHRRSVLKRTGLFDEKLLVASDWDMWLRISDRYKISHIKKIISRINFTKNSLTNSSRHYRWYAQVIKKRLFSKKIRKAAGIPFKGYFESIAFRLSYKYKLKRSICSGILRDLLRTA